MLTVEIRLILIARMCAKENSSKKILTDVFETSNNICAMEVMELTIFAQRLRSEYVFLKVGHFTKTNTKILLSFFS